MHQLIVAPWLLLSQYVAFPNGPTQLEAALATKASVPSARTSTRSQSLLRAAVLSSDGVSQRIFLLEGSLK